MPLLDVSDLTKTFGPTTALRRARFSLEKGEIHALVGENGAGKSTLIKILSGVHRKDSGRILLEGKDIDPLTPNEAHLLGISTVFQELSLCPNLSVSENIFANRQPSALGLIKRKALRSETEKHLDAFRVDVSPDTLVGELNIAQRQIVEIVKAISVQARVLILDEPTSSLEIPEVDRLFDLLKELRTTGTGIIFISHKLDEVFRIADRISVFRDGEHVGTREAKSARQDEIIRDMVGREISQFYPAKAARRGEERLRIEGFSLRGKFEDIRFVVREGEILGVAGLTGSGRSEVMQSVFGHLGKESGSIVYNGSPVHIRSPREAISLGIVYSPEDRKEQGLFLHHSVAMNIASSCLDRCSTSGFMSRGKEENLAGAMVRDLSIRTGSIDIETSALSGGNQQKVLLAKCLAALPRVLIVDEPTRGIDIGSKIEIYALLREFTRKGGAVVMISSELPEIIGLSDRVLVFKEGRIVGELSGGITESALMNLMFADAGE